MSLLRVAQCARLMTSSTHGLVGCLSSQTRACTYLSLQGHDGTMVAARTMEWGSFNNHPEIAFAPKGSQFKSTPLTKLGFHGKNWESDYDIMGLSAMNEHLDETFFADAVNSEGLTVHFLYHPGTADYPRYNPKKADETITVLDFSSYILSKCRDVKEAKAEIKKIRTIGKYIDAIKGIVPGHFSVADATGKEIIVEWLGKEVVISEKTVGVMTNSPSYDWHLTNLRNYLFMRHDDWKETSVNGVKILPTGWGSGLLGLPGDYTPVSRFVRAVALRQMSRRTDGGLDTVREVLRILESFQLPYEHNKEESMKDTDWDVMKYGSTLWTSAYDLKNLKMYYRTSKIPSIRSVDFHRVAFANMPKEKRTYMPLEFDHIEYAIDVTPKRYKK